MGCHTWFKVPVISGEKEIRELAEKNLESDDYFSLDHKAMYRFAIDNNLERVITELASLISKGDIYNEKWTLYQDLTYYSIDKYNAANSTFDKLNYYGDSSCWEEKGIESYSDEPRISGYPTRIVTSYEDMVDFMKTGFKDDHGKQYDFTYDEDRIERIMAGIKTFFTKHPKGIITFG